MTYICSLPVKKLLFSKVKTVTMQYTFVPNLTVGCVGVLTNTSNKKRNEKVLYDGRYKYIL